MHALFTRQEIQTHRSSLNDQLYSGNECVRETKNANDGGTHTQVFSPDDLA